MRSGGVLVHCFGRLSTAVSVLAAELLCGHGMLTQRALERRKAVHHLDGVVSHSSNCSRYLSDESERKSPSRSPKHDRRNMIADVRRVEARNSSQSRPATLPTRGSGVRACRERVTVEMTRCGRNNTHISPNLIHLPASFSNRAGPAPQQQSS